MRARSLLQQADFSIAPAQSQLDVRERSWASLPQSDRYRTIRRLDHRGVWGRVLRAQVHLDVPLRKIPSHAPVRHGKQDARVDVKQDGGEQPNRDGSHLQSHAAVDLYWRVRNV